MDPKDDQRFLASLLNTLKMKRGNAEFCSRLGNRFSTLRSLFFRLYGHRNDFLYWYTELIRILHRSYLKRSPELKIIDRAREMNPGWLLNEGLVSYTLYVDRFAGNLVGLCSKIPYFKELGANLIHLMPLLRCPPMDNDGGYAVSDYRAVQSSLGTMQDLRSFSSHLRKNQRLLQLDLVVNHTSDQHEWARRARKGEREYQDMYFTFDGRSNPDRFEESLPEVFPLSAPGNFTYISQIDKWVMTVFHNYQWDLNYTNPRVFLEMLQNLFFLADQGADVLRLDAIPYLWKRIGTNSRNQAEAHWICQLFHACIRVVCPGVSLVAEAVVEPREVVRYFGERESAGAECDMAYHVLYMVLLWDALATGKNSVFLRSLSSLPKLPANVTWLTYLRCHDDIGLGYDDADLRGLGIDPALHRRFIVDFYSGRYPGSYASGRIFMENSRTGDARISGTAASLVGLEKAILANDTGAVHDSVHRLLLLYGLVMSFGGLPVVYAGDEVGYCNDYSQLENNKEQEDNRWIHRPEIDWDKISRRNLSGTIEERIYRGMKNMITVRKATKEFSFHAHRRFIDAGDPHVLCFVRSFHEQRTMVLANLSNSSRKIDPLILYWGGLTGKIQDRLGSHPLCREGEVYVLPPYGLYWLARV